LAKDALEADKRERLVFGGMAHWDGLDLFGPNYMSVAYRRKGEIHVCVEPSNIKKPKNSTVQRISRLPIVRSVFFWGRLLLQVVGSLWVFLFFAATLAGLWLFVRLMEFGSGAGPLGGIFAFFAEFPILPMLLLFFAAMKFTPIGRYHGAEHKAVAAYEEHGEVTLEGARKSSRVHPRCGTNLVAAFGIMAFFWHTLDVPWLQWLKDAQPLPAMLTTLFLWRRLGGFIQQYLSTRPAAPTEINSGTNIARTDTAFSSSSNWAMALKVNISAMNRAASQMMRCRQTLTKLASR